MSLFTQKGYAAARRETERLSRELDITNADHVALWLEANIGDASLAYLAVRIVEAHEAAKSEPVVDGAAEGIATVKAFDAAGAECRRVADETRFAPDVMPGEQEWYKRGAQACAAAMGMLASSASKAVPLEAWGAKRPAVEREQIAENANCSTDSAVRERAWHPHIGERVEVVGEYAADWRNIDLWVAGVRVPDDADGLEVTVAEQWPIPHRHIGNAYKGQTDDFRVGSTKRPDDLRPVALLPTEAR